MQSLSYTRFHLEKSLEIARHHQIPIRIPLSLRPNRHQHIIPAKCPLTLNSIPSISKVASVTAIINALHAIVGFTLYLCFPTLCTMLGSHGGDKVDKEGENVECENERNSPFKHSCCVIRFLEIAAAKADSEGDLDEDEVEFDPEGDAEDSMFAEI